jgi:type II secretion system protein H
MLAQRRRRHRHAGFTLVELMVVVLVIAVLAMAVAPSVRRTMIEQKLTWAARDLMRVIRDARQNATVTRLAHLVHIDPANRQVRVLRGVNGSCLAQNWAARSDYCTENAELRRVGIECLTLSFDDPDYSIPDTMEVTLAEVVGANASTAARSICFSPGGRTYQAPGAIGATPLSLADNVGSGFLFEVGMKRVKTTAGEVDALKSLWVLAPTNGYPRLVR